MQTPDGACPCTQPLILVTICRVLSSSEWTGVREGLAALSTLLQLNDHRLSNQADRQAVTRATDAPARPPPASHIVFGALRLVQVVGRYANLLAALQAAVGDGKEAIVHIERQWFTDAGASITTQRQQFKTAIDALRAGDVRLSVHVSMYLNAHNRVCVCYPT